MMLLWIILLELVVLALIAYHKKQWLLQMYIVANMLWIGVFWQKYISTMWLDMNVWTLIYPFAVFTQYVLLKINGESSVIQSTKTLFITYVYFILLWYTISLLPIVSGNDAISHAITTLLWWSIRVIIASFVAFVIAQTVLIASYRRYGYFISTILMQLVDSFFFFWLAFGWVTMFMFDWFLSKVCIWILLYPLYKIIK